MKKEYYNLTNPQKAIWMIEQFYPNSNINSMGGYIRIHEEVDFEMLAEAYNLYLQKNDGLRLRIVLQNDVPVQYVADYQKETVKITDISREEFENKMKNYIPASFAILDSKLYSFELYRFEDGQGAFVAYLHHLICDAWTTSLFANGVMTMYHALKNHLNTDEIVFGSYLEFIENEKKYLTSDRFQNDKEYWDGQFTKDQIFTTLKAETAESTTLFGRKTFKLPSEILSKIKEYTQKYDSSVPAFLFSVYSLYFSKLLDTNKITMGNPVLNRSSFKEKNTFGTFISTVPVSIPYNGEESFEERTATLTKNQKSMYRHLKYPYAEIAKHVKELTGSSEKLYDIVFSYQNTHSNATTLDIPFDINWVPSNHQIESLMIHVADRNVTGTISINYDYHSDLYTEEEVTHMHERIERIMYQVLANPQVLCQDVEIVSLSEKNQLLRDFNNTECVFNKNATIVSEFEKVVLNHPTTVALTFGKENYTYQELNRVANQLANELIKNGVKPNDIVGILLPRGAEIIISILAILKCGATYMPIEPEYPESRVAFMIENSAASLIITTEALESNITTDANILHITSISFDKNLNTPNLELERNPHALAYIMYTSGTTGTPKAVMIRHYSVINFADCMKRRLDYSSSSKNKVLSVTTMCFDIFVFEVFPTLLSGLHLVMANEEEQKNPALLSKLIENKQICKLLTTPSRVQLLFLDSKYLNCLSTLKEIILGGEPFPTNFLTELPKYTQARIFNLYGPTETTVYSTYKELTNENHITIGKPIENTTIYILDKNKKLLPIGASGELYIGGAGVAKGYYKNEALTNEKFIVNPYNEDEIIYNTGDLAKWLPNGELICLGRTDNQIKIRGYRIELGDIETHVATFPGISKAVVSDKTTTDGKKFLCAYYIADQDISISELHKYLLSKLPNYMVPSSYMKLDSFPLTPNHKINRKALPMPTKLYTPEEEYVAPATETEKLLCSIAEKVLNVNKIGINDDIFSYSADSLSIIQMQTLLIPYGITFKTQDFYRLRTIKAFAEFISQKDTNHTEENFEDQSLYSVNQLLEKHSTFLDVNLVPKEEEKGYFLTGTTGFLGIHMLHELLSTTEANIYCAVREKGNQDAKTRIRELWNYYFPGEHLDEIRVHVVKCELTKKSFNLTNSELAALAKNISCVINCAANVKYYGDYAKHEEINVTGVKNLIDFCIQYHIHLHQISTTGVSGNYLVSQTEQNKVFSENDFYIGQNYMENVYIHSKFEAEKAIYENRNRGLHYNIFRVGNLTARLLDGVFQQNKDDNAFYNIIKFMVLNKVIPTEMLSQKLEFTPVDLCAKAVVLLTKLKNVEYKTFHVYDENMLSMQDLIVMLRNDNIGIQELPTEEFNQKVISLSKDEKAKTSLKAIVNDLDSKHGLAFMPSVIITNEITNQYLKKLNFTWPKINFDYINRLIQIILEDK